MSSKLIFNASTSAGVSEPSEAACGAEFFWGRCCSKNGREPWENHGKTMGKW
jgi:hypothetical protein